MLLALVCIPLQAHAMYENCIFSWEFGQELRSVLYVSPVGKVCAQRCANECQAFSRTGPYGELNQDVIDSCTMKCQSGQPFSSGYKIPDPDSTNWYGYLEAEDSLGKKQQISIGSYCSTLASDVSSAAYNYYSTGLTMKPGNTMTVSVFNSPTAQNAVYMCGLNTAVIYPTIYSFDPNYWDSNWAKWQLRNTDIKTWNARNANWTDTGIDVKDGDFLTLTISWGYANKVRGLPPIQYSLRVREPYTSSWNDINRGVYLAGTELLIPGMNKEGGYAISPQQAQEANAKYIFYGLTNSAYNQMRQSVVIGDGDPIPFYGYEWITYTGMMSGFSQSWTRLGLMHFDNPPGPNWNDNLGGAYVTVSRRGCAYYNGERLQYALVQGASTSAGTVYDPSASTIEWNDISVTDIQQHNQITLHGPGEGVLYLRIKPLSFESDTTPQCPMDETICENSYSNSLNNYGPGKTSGQYAVEVIGSGGPAAISSFVSGIISSIRSYLFGSADSAGKMQTIFNAMVADSYLVSAVRALMVLYLAYTGLSFIAGFAKITQQDAIIRFIKLGVVATLISPNSWSFFNTYIFNLFINGGLTLVSLVVASTNASPHEIAQIQQDPAMIFSIFDTPFAQLFSADVWLKIYALLLSSMLGFILAIILAFAIVTYMFCIVKAIIIYLISLVAIGILLLIAPVFISFILFEYTRQFFDAWMKQLLSFALQPVLIFSMIAMLNTLLMVALYITLSFTACKICLLGFDLPIVNYSTCIIPGYTTLWSMHYPHSDFLGAPISQVGALILFMLLAQSVYVLIDYCASVAAQLATGGFLGLNLANSFRENNPLTKGMEGLTAVTGVDEESTKSREQMTSQFMGGFKKGRGK